MSYRRIFSKKKKESGLLYKEVIYLVTTYFTLKEQNIGNGLSTFQA